MPVEPVRPDYGGASLEQVLPALVGRRDDGILPPPARGARRTALLVLDGLGWELLSEHAGVLPELAALTGGPITTVAPSTTATALTSLTTGLTPAAHGVLGFRMRVDGQVLNALRWTVDRGAPPAASVVQRHAPFMGRSVPVVTRSEFRTSGFTAAHLRDVPFVGWSTPAMLVEQVRGLAETDAPLVYVYWPGIDAVAHEFGLSTRHLAAELAFADELVGRLRDALPPEVALLVTADHGLVDVGDRWIDLAPLGGLIAHASGEGRFRWVGARRGADAELLTAAREHFGAEAWVWSREEVLDGGWLGPEGPTTPHRRRLGDVALIPHRPVGFVDPALPGERRLVGAHGSLTSAEMLVPLLAGSGRRG